MPKRSIQRLCVGPLALLCALLLAACATVPKDPAAPPIEWSAPVAWPEVPPGEATCPADDAIGSAIPCLSDRQAAQLMAGLADALDEANGRLANLRDWLAAYGAANGQKQANSR